MTLDAHGWEVRTTTGDPALPTVVLLHGVGAGAASFASLQDVLEGELRSVAYSRRAALHDRGPCALDALVDELVLVLDSVVGDEDVVLVGHSWGAVLARALATRLSERVRGVVLLDGTHERLAGVQRPAFRALTQAARLLSRVSFASPVRTTAVRELAAIPASLRLLPWPTQPVLAVVGGHGATARQRRVREDMRVTYAEVARQLPGTELVAVAGAGHRVAEDAPAETAALIRRFLATTTRPTSGRSAS